MYKYNKVKVPIYFWLPINKVEENAFKQAVNLANLPFAFRHVAIMPDTHSGFGMPIGGILATKGVVIPNAVGVDIGCGMHAFKTNLTKEQVKPFLKRILQDILAEIPTGFSWHKKEQRSDVFNKAPDLYIVQKHLTRAKKQLGTLGGGNHFIEIQYEVPLITDSSSGYRNMPLVWEQVDTGVSALDQASVHPQKSTNGSEIHTDKEVKPYVWVMLHSGSRNLGKQIADYYYKMARRMLEKQPRRVREHYPTYELAFLELGTRWGDEYWQAMQFAQEYALANRQHMAEAIKRILKRYFRDFKVLEEYDIHHNYAQIEEHFGKRVVVHRKGAVNAGFGRVGIIPGSMASASYIVVGAGNAQSFESSSHGAGRVMGRREALRRFSVNEVVRDLERMDVLLAKRNLRDVAEEARFVYKNIDEIMRYQRDLVYIKNKLLPMGVVKG